MSDGHSDAAKNARARQIVQEVHGVERLYVAPTQPMEAMKRVAWPETWMKVAHTMAERSYDPRLRVGAIVVSSDNTLVLSVGYNGNYKGGPHLHESPEPGKSGFIHAEVNALVKCDFNFPKPKHMYVTHSPCRDCSKLIINAGIVRVIYDHPYRDTSGIDLLKSVGIEVFSILDAIDAAIPKG
jgi:dCMP deaminase